VIEAVVFDLDGVLVDSEPVWEEVRRGVVEEFGGRWLPDAQRRMMGMSTPEWARYLSADLGVDLPSDEVARTVVDRVAARYDAHLPLLPGAAEAVRRIAGRWPLALATSSPRSLAAHVLKQAGVADRFGAVVSTEDLRRGKPAPDVYLAAAQGLGVPAERCAAVEDSTNGMRSALAAGSRVVALPRDRYPVDSDVLARADLVLSGLDGLTVEAVEQATGGS
jgi:HAD superfamily hydrolase (TIGR01509 family)